MHCLKVLGKSVVSLFCLCGCSSLDVPWALPVTQQEGGGEEGTSMVKVGTTKTSIFSPKKEEKRMTRR